MTNAPLITHVRPVDLLSALRGVMSPRSVHRNARRLGAVKIGGLLAVPVARIREVLGDDVAAASVAAAELRGAR